MSELLERCLAKSPHDRFPSFAEVLQNLHPAPGAPSPWEVSDDPELIPYLSRYQARRQVYLTGQLGLHEGDTYEFPRGQVLRILRGDLVHQDVDAIVSSDTNYLTMTYGLSEAIRLAAGPVIRQEAKRYVPVLPGRAVVTSGGDLRARFVFHSATIGKSFYQVVLPSRDLISEIMASCFYHADSLYVQSIAFPLLGTGGAGLSKTVCLDTMFQFLSRMLLRGLTVVRDARIILFP